VNSDDSDGTGRLTCDFCEHRCSLKDGQTGLCGVRTRRGDAIVTANYGEHVSLAVDPIEKKPLYHVLPGAKALSSALYGCNFRCSFCQNCTISQPKLFRNLATRYISPEELARKRVDGGYPVVAFTYSEPTVWQDYMINTAAFVHRSGGRTAMITNGFFTDAALDRLHPAIDAFNIDLKGDEEFYRALCGGHVAPILRNITRIAREGRSVLEVTTMVMEGVHTVEGVVELGLRLSDAGVKVWHLSAFHPAYKMQDRPATRPEFLDEIYDRVIKETAIPHVYAFSRRNAAYQQTRCPSCGALCIDRRHFAMVENALNRGRCPSCGEALYGLFA
jgi:pyruvate formate lyase activating enzyme